MAPNDIGITTQEVLTQSSVEQRVAAEEPDEDSDAATVPSIAVETATERTTNERRPLPLESVQAVVEHLEEEGVLRTRNDPDTGREVYQLYHDYLSRAVLEAERRAERWPAVIREAQKAFEDSQGHLWRRWNAMLTLWQQLRLLVERLRGRFRYGESRQFALLSTVRTLPHIVVIMAITLGVLQFQRLQRANEARNEARAILAELRDNEDDPSPNEFKALQRLAETEEDVRLSAIIEILETKEQAKRLQRRLPYVLHAVVGLNTSLRDRVQDVLKTHATTPADDVDLNRACADLGASLDIDDPSFNSIVVANYVAAVTKTTDPDALSSLGSALVNFGKKLPAEPAAVLAGQIVAAMEKTTNYRALSSLGRALGSFGEKLPPEQAAVGAQRIVAAMERTTNVIALSSLGSALGSLGEKLPPEQAAVGAQRIVAAMEKTTEYRAVSSLRIALGSLGEMLPTEQAADVAGEILAAMEKTTEYRAVSSLGIALGSFGEKLSPEQAAVGAGRILAAMEKTTDANALFTLSRALGGLSDKLPPEQAAIGAQRIVAAMEKTTDAFALFSLCGALGGLSDKLPPEQAAVGAGQIVAAMKMMTGARIAFSFSGGVLGELSRVLGSLARILKPKDAVSVLKSVVCLGKPRDEVLLALEKKSGKKFNGSIWKVVEWAEEQGIDVNNVPRFPLARSN